MKQIFKAFIVVLFVSLLFSSCNKIGAGSFPYAEVYPLELPKELLIEKISTFKNINPQYQCIQIQPDGSLKEEKDHYYNKFYIVYFYLSNHNIVLHCVVSRNANNLAELGLYRMRYIDGRSKAINTSDFTKKENAEYKKLFEKEILIPLKEFISGDQ